MWRGPPRPLPATSCWSSSSPLTASFSAPPPPLTPLSPEPRLSPPFTRRSVPGQRLQDVPVRRQAPVHPQVDAGDRRGLVGGEEQEQLGDLIRPDQALDRHPRERAVEVLHELRP